MGAIDIGAGATDRSNSGSLGTYTFIDRNNVANDTGTLTSIEVYIKTGYTGAGFKVGTATGSSTTYNIHDYESLGDVSGGSKQTFSGLNCDVTSGDSLAVWGDSGELEMVGSGATAYRKEGDLFSSGNQTGYTDIGARTYSLYGTGTTPTVRPFFADYCGGLNIDMTGGI